MEKGQVIARIAQKQNPLLPYQHDDAAFGMTGDIININVDIQVLEKEVGTPVLTRTTHGVALSEAGKVLVQKHRI